MIRQTEWRSVEFGGEVAVQDQLPEDWPVVGFEHGGFRITDPWRDETAREDVSPGYYDFDRIGEMDDQGRGEWELYVPEERVPRPTLASYTIIGNPEVFTLTYYEMGEEVWSLLVSRLDGRGEVGRVT